MRDVFIPGKLIGQSDAVALESNRSGMDRYFFGPFPLVPVCLWAAHLPDR